MSSSFPHLAYAAIKQRAPTASPRVAIVLGSGLGGLTQHIQHAITIPYTALPGFPTITVEGHHGQLILGELAGVPVACLQGRAHAYEGHASEEAIRTYVRTLRLLGCDFFIATNAAGSLRASIGPGELMLITDHINLQPSNPLIGPNDETFGPRFYPLDQAYHPLLRDHFLNAAEQAHISLHQGTYISVLGPHYETAAEIKAFRLWGADAVGMSTVPEVLVANHCGMKVAVISMITNYATGLATESHQHSAVIKTAARGSDTLSQLMMKGLASIAADPSCW